MSEDTQPPEGEPPDEEAEAEMGVTRVDIGDLETVAELLESIRESAQHRADERVALELRPDGALDGRIESLSRCVAILSEAVDGQEIGTQGGLGEAACAAVDRAVVALCGSIESLAPSCGRPPKTRKAKG